MKRRLFCAALLLMFARLAGAQQTVMLEQDIACDSVEVQQLRVQLTRIIMTTDNEQSKDEATRKIVELTRQRCVPLTGIFTVKEKTNGLLKVITTDGTQLWLVE
ncbi:hypothetical protein [Herbaspirillum robiniae]|uniref:hypothetical protein n=1 Tax=Herbaspirillum robiniae TaxID=2014887 RepID=UPI003D77FDAB